MQALSQCQGPSIAGADPGGVRWVRTNPPSSLQYQLLLRAELILGCKHSKKSGELNRRWLADAQVDGPCDGCNAVSVIIDGWACTKREIS